MKEEILDIDKLISDSTYGWTTHSIQRDFLKWLSETARNTNSTKIITNGNVASVLQDITSYSGTFQDINNNIIYNSYGSDIRIRNGIYIYGKLNETMLFVDPNLKWDNNKIYFVDKNEQQVLGIVKDDKNVLL